ncbi:uncharacterized protein LAESUDRAFT_736205 [Laetiporus sulphureus 93-53]|uniref:RING-type domain-containing protein n=1 Tax=Laetiporus sulphureus 93-53 TaxID=1314785 RepID=A0A165EZA0_9APHY|nr:uncharacterized protein LAESUDRAFT_736205 [Laetiporus sulphureus 93-53]KZT08029.1 hypothetical protein LAESUDRAFT_736205 [Laetiporus sulphureus 93-53]
MSDVLFIEAVYCSLCDRYFPSDEARAEHVQHSNNHPQCVACNRRFANKNSLRNHLVLSRRHHYCSSCDREFQTAAGLRVHIEYSSVHRDDSDDEEDEEPGEPEGWEDRYGPLYFPDENRRAEDDFDLPYDDEVPYEDEYWDEDDVAEIEDEIEPQQHYNPPVMRRDPDNLSTDTIRDIPVGTTASSTADEFQPEGVLFNCPLCLEAPNETSATRCGHVFCTSCIRQALDIKPSCPVCRKGAVHLQLRKIYLSAN